MITKTVNANALNIPLRAQSIQCVITSPPYFGLRDYGHVAQIGLEKTPDAYINKLVRVFREVWRVLRNDGVVWLNLGDSYNAYKANTGDTPYVGNSNRPGRRKPGYGLEVKGLKNKNLIGIPWRVAFALQTDGWYLRQDVIWHKPNPMPESVTDRCTKAHEYIFLLSKNERYFYDHEAIKEAAVTEGDTRHLRADKTALHRIGGPSSRKQTGSPTSNRNKRSVWSVNTHPYKGAHFATFPPKLVEPMVLAGSQPGDWILDPFAGTATVGSVSIKHKRNFIGLEINPDYIELAERRNNNIQLQMI